MMNDDDLERYERTQAQDFIRVLQALRQEGAPLHAPADFQAKVWSRIAQRQAKRGLFATVRSLWYSELVPFDSVFPRFGTLRGFLGGFALLILVSLAAFHRGKSVGYGTGLRTGMQGIETIAKGIREVSHLQLLSQWDERSTAKEPQRIKEEAAQRIKVVSAAVGGQIYLFPTLWEDTPTELAILVEELKGSTSLYNAYLWQWGAVFALQSTEALMEAGKISEAIQVLEHLRQKMPLKLETQRDKKQFLVLLYRLGEVYKMNEDHQAAITVYDDIIARGIAPDDPRPAHYLGWSAYKLGKYDKALKYYEDALDIYPSYAKVFYNKALVFRDQGHMNLYQKNIEEALTLTMSSYELEGDENPRIPFTLAILYTVLEDFDNAFVYLEKALRKGRLYVIRAQKEHAFAIFRDRANEPYYSKFQKLLARYRRPSSPLIFIE